MQEDEHEEGKKTHRQPGEHGRHELGIHCPVIGGASEKSLTD